MTASFSGPVWYWRGPAPWFFVSVPAAESTEIKALERTVTYGWGMIPAIVQIGRTQYKTALWPKDGGYIVPLNVAVRRTEQIEEGDTIEVLLKIVAAERPEFR